MKIQQFVNDRRGEAWPTSHQVADLVEEACERFGIQPQAPLMQLTAALEATGHGNDRVLNDTIDYFFDD